MLLQFREQASSQSFPDLGIPNESQFRAVGITQFKPLFVVERKGVKLLSKMFRLSDGKTIAPSTNPTSRAPVSNLKKN
jgi:hypothetical protein